MQNRVYLIGIGGIGMSAIARHFNFAGSKVGGYDLTPSALTEALVREGIDVTFSKEVDAIPPEFRDSKGDTLVIYTPAIPNDHPQLRYFVDNGFHVIKRSVALGHIAKDKSCLAVAGTHGKTTTSTLLAHIVKQAFGSCTAFLGGISKNTESNLMLGKNQWLVAEADEFDRSFLQLFPHAAVITSADADHLDIYGTHDEVKRAFAQFAGQIEENGTLILKKGVELNLNLKSGVKLLRYSYTDKCDFYASNISVENGESNFDINYPGGVIENCHLMIPGGVNIENSVAAAAVALSVGADAQAIKEAIGTFRGVRRRLDIRYKSHECCYIDDYAHHPAEIAAAITSVRQLFPNRELTGIFQPHLYTRTRDFAAEFAQSLNLLDKVILLPIYPARELPIEGVSAKIIAKGIDSGKCQIMEYSAVLDYIRAKRPQLLLTIGAGDIGLLAPEIQKLLEEIKL